MKRKWKLVLTYVLLSATAVAQIKFDNQLAIETAYPTIKEAKPPKENQATFEANYFNHKIYFTTEFGIDNRAVIDVYNISGDFVMSIQVKSNSPEVKQFIWNDYEKLQYKLKRGNYKAICRIKGKKDREITFKIN